MKLYHWTNRENLESIFKEGLRPSGFGIVYLAPHKDDWEDFHGTEGVCLEVETRDLKLTAFEDCKEWEVLCWGHIPPEDLNICTTI